MSDGWDLFFGLFLIFLGFELLTAIGRKAMQKRRKDK